MDSLPFVSVIIPVWNREKHIGKCLKSLLDLDYPSYEIIVVDNGSTDRTQNIVSQYPVKMIVEKRRGAYAARNSGVESARGEIIAFTDSDCIVDRQWIRQLVNHYSRPKVGGAGGHLLPYEPAGIVEQFLSFGELRIFHSPRATVMRRNPNRFLSGALGSANMSYRRSVLKELKGFNEEFIFFCGAYDFCWRVQRAGHDVVYDPEAVVFHKLRGTIIGLAKQLFLFGKDQPQLLKKQPEKYSYFCIKTYFSPNVEFRCRLPLRMLVTLDFAHLMLLLLILIIVNPFFLYLFLPLFLAVSFGAWRRLANMAKKKNPLKWMLLFPLLHFIRTCSFTLGRIAGGITYRVIAI